MLGSVIAYSGGIWHFNEIGKRAISFELLSMIKPVIETFILLIFANEILKFDQKYRAKQVWKKIIFYSITLSTLSWGIILSKFNIFDFVRSIFPVIFQTNKIALAVLIMIIAKPWINKLNGIGYKFFGGIFLALSVIPTLLWATRIPFEIDFTFGTMLWGLFLLFTVKKINDFSKKQTTKLLKWSLIFGIISAIFIVLIANMVQPQNAFLYAGNIIINRLAFLMPNLFASLISLGMFLAFKNKDIIRYFKLDLLLGASLFSTHFLFIKPFWRTICGSSYWITVSTLSLIKSVTISVIIATIFTFTMEYVFNQLQVGKQSRRSKNNVAIYSAICAACFSNLIMAASNSSFNLTVMFNTVRNKPLLMILNVIILFIFIMLIFAIINRLIMSLITYGAILLIFTIANYQKILSRDEPILPVDITSNLNNIGEVVKLVDIKLVIVSFILIICLFIGGFLWERKIKFQAIFNIFQRLLIFIVGSVIIGFLMVKLPLIPSSGVTWKAKDHTVFNNIMADNLHYRAFPGSVKTDFKSNGPVIALMSRMIIPIMEKPAGYSAKEIRSLSTKLEREASEINKNRSNDINNDVVIYILSESFANPLRVPGVNMKNPIPYTNKIMSKTTSGIMDSYGYGGGTADMEYEALTGMSLNNFSPAMSTPYVELMPKISYQPSVLDLFKTKNAIHPFQPTYYNRVNAFKQLGFSKFYNLYAPNKVKYTKAVDGTQAVGSHITNESKYISDDSAYRELKLVMDKNKGGQFIQLSTIQNHMPYSKNEYGQSNKISVSGDLTADSLDKLKTYSYGINQTDKDLKKLIKQVDQEKRNVTIVFYGDHLPGLYDWKENDSQKKSQYDSEIHQTDYFIYSNHSNKKVKKAVAAPYMFTPMMLEQTNSKVSPYYALLTKCMKELPAGERDKYMLSNGKQVSEKKLSTKQKELLREYKLIQYDITAGKHYLNKNSNFFEVQ